MAKMSGYGGLFDFSGQVVVVTGGAGLLGREIVKCFSCFGAKVVIADINREVGKDLELKVTAEAGDAIFFLWDMSNVDNISQCIDEIEKSFGSVNVWVNNAYPRTDDWGNRLEDVTIESWRKNIDMHLNGYCICSNEIAKRMAKRGGGSITNVGSIQSVVAPDFRIYEGTDMTSPAAYTAIKGGILMYSKYLASYYGRSNVRVNVVCPGGIMNNQPIEFLNRYCSRTPLGRLAKPEEIASAILFLSSAGATYITGTALMVDGGLTAT